MVWTPLFLADIICDQPLTAYHIPHTSYHLPLTTYNLPLTNYHLQLTINRLQLGIIHHLPLNITFLPISRTMLDDLDIPTVGIYTKSGDVRPSVCHSVPSLLWGYPSHLIFLYGRATNQILND